MRYVGPRSVIDNLGFVCTHQKSTDKGGKFNNKQKEKAERTIQEIPRVSAGQPQLLTLLASWVSEGPPPPLGCICIAPTKPSIPLPEQEESQHQGKSRAGTHNPGSSKQSATLESPGSPREDAATSVGWCWEHGVPSQTSRFESHLCHLGAVWPEVSYWTSLCLGFIAYQRGKKLVSTSWVAVG